MGIGSGPHLITASEAAPYFKHPAQMIDGMFDEPEDWMQFRAMGGVCWAFHQHLWPGVWMGHIGALPGVYRVDDAALTILRAFADKERAARIIGWVKEKNRPVLALGRRIGFEIDGRMPLAEPVVLLGWRP
jgi:hypothetical protein